MSTAAWFSVVVAGLSMLLMAITRITPAAVLLGAAALLVVAGVLTPAQALAGFSNTGVATIALLYVVVAGVRETGGLELLISNVLGRPRNLRDALLRLTLPVAAASGFVNNTPLVAAYLPAVITWARRRRLSPSRLLIPLSYAAMLGGTLTLVGTSTNLVVNGLLRERGHDGFDLFDITPVGLPLVVIGVLYLVFVAPRLLPDRAVTETGVFGDPREYTVEMTVEADGPLVGRSVEQAGLRHLGDLFLVEIERDGRLLVAVDSVERLQAGDRLLFAGAVESVLDLQNVRGLTPSAEPSFSLHDRDHPERVLVEAVVSQNCALVGRSLREGQFRMRYGAAVLAIARQGRRLRGRLGDIRLRPGDTLLLEARRPFLARHQDSRDFLLMSERQGVASGRRGRAWLAWLILLLFVVANATGLVAVFTGALVAAVAVLATGCCSFDAARRGIDTSVLVAIALAFALGNALDTTGAARAAADVALGLAGHEPVLLLAATYLVTTLMTEVVTNNAVAVVMVPIALAIAESLGLPAEPFAVVIMMAASASFMTPLGYQTNLMVLGVGGYRFADFLRCGAPLNLLSGIVTVTMVTVLWPMP